MLKYLEDLSAVEDYLRCVGRLHYCAGVDPHYLDLTGLAFCQALEHLGHHVDIWNSEVSLIKKHALDRVILGLIYSS